MKVEIKSCSRALRQHLSLPGVSSAIDKNRVALAKEE
jgi:hypothetical protein